MKKISGLYVASFLLLISISVHVHQSANEFEEMSNRIDVLSEQTKLHAEIIKVIVDMIKGSSIIIDNNNTSPKLNKLKKTKPIHIKF